MLRFEMQHERSRVVGRSKLSASRLAAGRPGEVLIIDDDRSLTQQLVSFLSARDCRAQATHQVERMLALLHDHHWSLILLDFSGGDGLNHLREIRSISDVPILVTGHNLSSADRILALELGADGYIPKPFDLNEFWSYARAIARRQQLARSQGDGRRRPRAYRFNGWTLRLSDRSLISPGGRPVRMPRSAFALLIAFLEAPGRPLSRAYLLQATLVSEDVFDRSIDVRILRLRRVFQRAGASECLIRTEHGIGYVFDAVVEHLH
jgi:two-component system, OmpR family, response regulator